MPPHMAGEVPRAHPDIGQERVMRDFHRRLAEIALRAAESYGFVLAGGYAISSNGMGDRPSADVDLFTNQFQPDKFAEALDAVRRAFRDNQLEINDNFIGPLFADMKITDPRTGESRSRSHPTIRVRTPRRFSH